MKTPAVALFRGSITRLQYLLPTLQVVRYRTRVQGSPRGPRSDAGYVVPHPHHLIGLICPTRKHIEISPHCGLYPMPLLGDNRLGPQVVPCFRCMFLLDMPSSRSPESSSVILTQSLHRRHWPSPRGGNGSALSIFLTIRFRRGALISGLLQVRFRYGLSSC